MPTQQQRQQRASGEHTKKKRVQKESLTTDRGVVHVGVLKQNSKKKYHKLFKLFQRFELAICSKWFLEDFLQGFSQVIFQDFIQGFLLRIYLKLFWGILQEIFLGNPRGVTSGNPPEVLFGESSWSFFWVYLCSSLWGDLQVFFLGNPPDVCLVFSRGFFWNFSRISFWDFCRSYFHNLPMTSFLDYSKNALLYSLQNGM